MKKKSLWAALSALAITVLYFIWAYNFFSFVYDINDDVAMRNVAAGVITGVPDAHLIHMKYVWGLLISGLYGALPGWDWYGILMLLIISLSLWAWLYRGLESSRKWTDKLLLVSVILLLFSGVVLRHAVFFQWTVTAAIAGGTGIFLFLTNRGEDNVRSFAEEGLAAFFLLLALCIRDDVFLLTLPAAGLVFWGKYGSLDKVKKKLQLRHWQICAGLLFGIGLILAVEKAAYGSDQWKEFLSYNLDREAVMDYYGLAAYEEDREFFESQEMSEEEVVNLHRYSLYLVPELYPQKMHAIAVRAEQRYNEKNSVGVRLKSGLKKSIDHLMSQPIRPVAAVTILLCLSSIFCCLREKKNRLTAVLLNVLFCLYWVYVSFRGRVVDRVVYALLLLQIFTYLGMLGAVFLHKQTRSRRFERLFLGTAVLLLGLFCRRQLPLLQQQSQERAAYNQQFLDINEYMAEHMENVYFMTTFSIETYTDNFSLRKELDFTNLLSVGGWHSFSSLENEKIRKLGLGGETMEQAMLTGENVYVISCVSVDYMDRYFTRRYGEDYPGKRAADSQVCGDTEFVVYDFSVR